MADPISLGIMAALAGLGGASGLSSYFGSRGREKQLRDFQSRGGVPGVTSQQIPGLGDLTSISRLDPQQQGLQSQLLSLLSGQLGGQPGTGQAGGQPAGGLLGGGQFGQDPISMQARKQFSEQSIPQLLERFAGQGQSFGRSSGVQNAVLRAQGDLESQLAGQQFGMLQNLLGLGLTPTTEQTLSPQQPGFLESLFGGLTKGASSAIPSFAAQYGLGQNTLGGTR